MWYELEREIPTVLFYTGPWHFCSISCVMEWAWQEVLSQMKEKSRGR